MPKDVLIGVAYMLAMLAAVLLAPAEADDGLPAAVNATWHTECGACHVPYPPKLLPARSWREVMGGLDRHFGTDASLDPTAAAGVAAFLEQHAGRDRGEPPTIRITETAWFRRKHRKVSPVVWRRAEVRSPANCAACHPAAGRGGYDEHAVRLPR